MWSPFYCYSTNKRNKPHLTRIYQIFPLQSQRKSNLQKERYTTIKNRPSSNTKVRACIVGATSTAARSGIQITLSTEDISTGTGHVEARHTGTRPHGDIGRKKGVTNATGCFETTYRPTFISAEIKIMATSPSFIGEASRPLKVRVPGLVDLGRGTNYRLNGSSDPRDCDAPECTAPAPPGQLQYMAVPLRKAHPFNHYVVAASVPKLKKIADDYKSAFYGSGSIHPDQMITYNDASLRWGGEFELRRKWLNPGAHGRHREGKNIDLKTLNIPNTRITRVIQIANANGFGTLHHYVKAPHLHLIWGNGI